MTPAKFNLCLWFSITAFSIITVLSLVAGMLLMTFISRVMLEREVTLTRDFLQSVIEAEELGAATFQSMPQTLSDNLAEFERHIENLPEIIRANLYAPDRTVIWSTDPGIVGQRFTDNDELEEALAGRMLSETVSTAGDVKTEHAALQTGSMRYYIEAYVPLTGSDGKVIAVAELYKVPGALEAVLQPGRVYICSGVAAGALILFAALFWIVRRGAAVIARQQTALTHMESLAALGQMAGSIAHNLRNPLAGMRSSAELLKWEMPDAADSATEIIGEIDYLERCVRQLLEFTRTEAVTAQGVDPLDLVSDILGQQGAALRRGKVSVTVEDRRAGHRSIEVDPRLLSQAITSILVNAREAAGEAGRLLIEIYDSGPKIGIAITDNGPGLAPEALSRVGEPFFTTKTRGLGLGVALARRIIERFGGTLDIHNVPTGGARVQIALAAA